MQRHVLLVIAVAANLLIGQRGTRAEFACMPPAQAGQQCSAFVSPTLVNSFRPVRQQTPVTCWAATIVNLIQFSHVLVPESEVVQKNTPVLRTADPSLLEQALNNEYEATNGRTVTIEQLAVTDRAWGSRRDIDNMRLIKTLKDGVPLFYGDANHAMVLIGVTFVMTPLGPNIIEGVVIDPAIGGVRRTMPPELFGMYAAIVAVRVT